MYTYEQVKKDIEKAEGITQAERGFLLYECDKCKDLSPEQCQRLFISIERAIGSYQAAHEQNNPITIFNHAVKGMFTDVGHFTDYFEELLPFIIITIIIIGSLYTLKNVKDLIK